MDEELKIALKAHTEAYLERESLEDLTSLLQAVYDLAATHGISSVELQGLVLEHQIRNERFGSLLEE